MQNHKSQPGPTGTGYIFQNTNKPFFGALMASMRSCLCDNNDNVKDNDKFNKNEKQINYFALL